MDKTRKSLSLEIEKIKKELYSINPFQDFSSKLKHDTLKNKLKELEKALEKLPLDNEKSSTDYRTEIDELKYLVQILTKRIDEMKLNLEVLAAEVTRTQTVQESAVKLLKSLTEELTRISAALAEQANKQPEPIDMSELDSFVGKLKESTDALAGAVKDSSDVMPTPVDGAPV